ncbi:MAG: serine protease [Blastochloris sp.]|nr:serine protease [Blastochloris sp.]
MKLGLNLLLSGWSAFLFLFISPLPAQTTTESSTAPKKVYVIPVEGPIEDALTFLIRRGVKEAIENKADLLILDMDTPGGKVSSTLEILKILERFPDQKQTFTYINPWAVSAGAFISAGTHRIYMSPAAIIGAAAPVVASSSGGAEDLPSTMEEKQNSALRAQIRAFAERQGHRPEVFNAMVDKDQGLTINGKEIVPKGKIVTLTSKEAAETFDDLPLLSRGTYNSLDDMIREVAGPNAIVTRVEPTGFEAVGRFIVTLSPLLLGAALLCGYVEFKTPGFGLFGSLAVLFALIFFFGHYVAGLSGYGFVLVFLLGLALIFAELFILPGTLVLGLSGLLLVVVSLLKTMVDRYPTDPFIPTVAQIQTPMMNLGLALVLSVLGMLVLLRILPHTPLYSRLILPEGPVNAPAPLPTMSPALQPGDEGLCLSLLRPSGTADFGQGPVDVVTEGLFVEPGTRVKVIRREGFRTVVEPV